MCWELKIDLFYFIRSNYFIRFLRKFFLSHKKFLMFRTGKWKPYRMEETPISWPRKKSNEWHNFWKNGRTIFFLFFLNFDNTLVTIEQCDIVSGEKSDHAKMQRRTDRNSLRIVAIVLAFGCSRHSAYPSKEAYLSIRRGGGGLDILVQPFLTQVIAGSSMHL